MTIPWPDLPTAAAFDVLPLLEKGLDQDWYRPAGDTAWSLRQLLDHVTLGVTGYAALLIARPTDRYIALRTGNDPHPTSGPTMRGARPTAPASPRWARWRS